MTVTTHQIGHSPFPPITNFLEHAIEGQMKKITKLTPEQEAQIPVIRDEFLRHGLSTEPADFDAAGDRTNA